MGQERQAVKDFTRDQTKYKDHDEYKIIRGSKSDLQ